MKAQSASLGGRITAARLNNGLTQSQLGLLVGCSKSFMCRLEGGSRECSVYILSRIAKELSVTYRHLSKRRVPSVLKEQWGKDDCCPDCGVYSKYAAHSPSCGRLAAMKTMKVRWS